MSRAARNVVLVFGQHIVGAVTGIVGVFFVFRHMSDPNFHWGVVSFALALGAMFSFVLRAFDQAHVKRLSEGLDHAECNGTFLLLKSVAAVTYTGLLLGGIYTWTTVVPVLTGGRYGGGFETPVHELVILLAILYYLLNAVGELSRRTFEGRNNMLIGQVTLMTEHVVKTGAIVYVSMADLGTTALAWSYVVGAAALAWVAVLYVVREPFGRPTRRMILSYWSFTLHTLAANTFGSISRQMGPIAVQLFWSSSVVTFLTAPMRFVQFIKAGAGAVGTVLLPQISGQHARGEGSGGLVARSMMLSMVAMGPVAAVLIALPDGIIHVLMSDKALPAATPMRLLAAIGFMTTVGAPLGTKILGIDRPDITKNITMVLIVVNLVLLAVFVPTSLFGIPMLGGEAVGAAAAQVLVGLTALAINAIVVRRLTGFTIPLGIWRPLVATAVATLVLYASTFVVSPLSYRFWHLPLAGVSALAVFWTTLWLVNGITDDDKALMRLLLHPGEWARCVATEADTRRP